MTKYDADWMREYMMESAHTFADTGTGNLDAANINAMYEAVRMLQAEAPPKTEIWVTEAVPQFDNDGEYVIIKINVREFEKSSWSPKLNMIPAATLDTMTGADEVIMLHPLTYEALGEYAPRGVPVFTDKQRRKILTIE